MESKVATVKNSNGLHLRTAAEVVKISKKYDSRISLAGNTCPHADACSVLQLLLLEASQGTPVTIHAEGPDEKEAVKALADFFEYGGGI